jgi:hypothetical protein
VVTYTFPDLSNVIPSHPTATKSVLLAKAPSSLILYL